MVQSITLQTSDPIIVSGDNIGRLAFAASSEASAGDSIKVAGIISVVAEAEFTSAANAASMVFSTSATDTASGQYKITSVGDFLPMNGGQDLGSTTNVFTSLYVDNIQSISEGIVLSDNTPSVTTNALYNVGGSLYFNGSTVGVSYTGTSGVALQGTTFYLNGTGNLSQLNLDNGTDSALNVSGTTLLAGTGVVFEVQNTGGTALFAVEDSTEVQVIIAAQPTQTGNPFEVRDAFDDIVAYVDVSGNISGNNVIFGDGTTQTTAFTGYQDLSAYATTGDLDTVSGIAQGAADDVSSSSGWLQSQINSNDTDITALQTATGNLDSDLTTVSGLLYNNWNVNVTGNVDSITSNETVIFTGLGSTTITYNNTTNTVSVSGTDTDTTYTAASGITLEGSTFTMSGTGSLDRLYISGQDPNISPLTISGAPSQSKPLTEWYGSDGTLHSQILPNGSFSGELTTGIMRAVEFWTVPQFYSRSASEAFVGGYNHQNLVGIMIGQECKNDQYGITIGYQVGYSGNGNKDNLVGIGKQALYRARAPFGTVAIGGLAGYANSATSTMDAANAVFIGYTAGYQISDTPDGDFTRAIIIGTSAGQNSYANNYSIYIGDSAGDATSGNYNIGIGQSSLEDVYGNNNLEIVTQGAASSIVGANSNKLHIENIIIGDTSSKLLAIGNVTSANLTPDATLEILPAISTDVGLIVQGAASQSANLQEWQDSAGTVLAQVTNTGHISVPRGTDSEIFGDGSNVVMGSDSIALVTSSSTAASNLNQVVAIGADLSIVGNATRTVVIGQNANVANGANNNVVIGADVTASSSDSDGCVIIGQNANGAAISAIAIGRSSTANTRAIAIGQSATAASGEIVMIANQATGIYVDPEGSLTIRATGIFQSGVQFPDGVTQTIAYTGQVAPTGMVSWNLSVSGASDSITDSATVTFTGLGLSTVTYDEATNTVYISGSGGGGGTTYTAGSGLTLDGTEFNIYGGTGQFKQVLFESDLVQIGSSTTANGAESISIGVGAGNNSNGSTNLIAIGGNAGNAATNANLVVSIGDDSCSSSQSLALTNAIGYFAGASASGTSNNYMGILAGNTNKGDNNVGIGNHALDDSDGSGNIEIVAYGLFEVTPTILGDNSNKIHIGRTLIGDTSSRLYAIGNVGASNLTPDATLEILPKVSTDIGLIVQGATSQSANLQEWQNSSASILAYVDTDGMISGSGITYTDGTISTSIFTDVVTDGNTGITYSETTFGGKYVRLTNSLDIEVSIPSGLNTYQYTETLFEQAAAGQITVTGQAGVTLNFRSSNTSAGQYAVITLKKIATDTYILFGDVT